VLHIYNAAGDYGPNVGQAIFAVWMAIGNILGYTAGANGKWHQYVLLFSSHLLNTLSYNRVPSY
jgi:hypothetical protein